MKGNKSEAIDNKPQHLSIAKNVGERAGEEHALGNLVNAYQDFDDFEKAIEYHKNISALQRSGGQG